MNRQSGKWRGKAFIQGRRVTVRRALYMPALIATRFNPDLRCVYQRLAGAGKTTKITLTAIMRKIVIPASALLKAGRKWQLQTP